MSLQAVEQFSSNLVNPFPRALGRRVQPRSFAAGTALLAILTPVTRVLSTGFYQMWTAPISEIDTLTKSGTYTGGTYTITIDGATTAAIAWNASNAAILAALNALPNVSPGDVVVSGGGAAGISTGAVTLTFAQKFSGQAIVVSSDPTNITGGGTIVFAQSTAGVQQAPDTSYISGFVWSDPIQLVAGGETLGNVMLAGDVNANDIPIVSGYILSQLQTALRDNRVRQNGLFIQGVTGL